MNILHRVCRGSKWLGIGADQTGNWNREGKLIQISDIVTDSKVFEFEASEYNDMSVSGNWNHEIDVSDAINVTGLFFSI